MPYYVMTVHLSLLNRCQFKGTPWFGVHTNNIYLKVQRKCLISRYILLSYSCITSGLTYVLMVDRRLNAYEYGKPLGHHVDYSS